MTGEAKSCPGCPASRGAHLVQLGLDLKRWDHVVALTGNPNTGKSTVFNALTGLRQHTGNWPGKTVVRAEGGFSWGGKRFKLVDLPGTYSLLSTSHDEEIARDFILFGRPDVSVVVVDATRLERNLNLVLQVLEITDRVVVSVNLMDEARRHGLRLDIPGLCDELGVPAVPMAARYLEGVTELNDAIAEVAAGKSETRPRRVGGQSAVLRDAVGRLSDAIEGVFPGVPNAQWVALRLLDGDERIEAAVTSGELGGLRAEDGPLERREGALRDGSGNGKEARGNLLLLASELRWDAGAGFHEALVETIYTEAARIAGRVVHRDAGSSGPTLDRRVDRLVTSRTLGFPIMLLLLTGVFWLTISGANIPSRLLGVLLIDTIHPALKDLFAGLSAPQWLSGVLVDGAYLTTAWVVKVMLPPMAIFFPLFTLLEDAGYLPRVAFNLDRMFQWAGAHGKQALTMCMGYGCNAAGVVSTRIIDSPRERLIAIVTNNFALCNGRWPTQILIATIFIGALAPPALAGLVSALAVVAVAVLGVALTFLASRALSRTFLRGEVSTFSLELPPYRPPRILRTLYTSLIDRTAFVLWRAVLFAIPVGAVIWTISNAGFGGASLAERAVDFLDPFGLSIGLNGVIILAYIVAVPANEIVIPTVLVLTVLTAGLSGVGEGTGVLFELDSGATSQALRAGGWTLLTAVNLMLFSLIHNPCSTTLYTIWKETRSIKWTALSALLPLALGVVVCFLVAQLWRTVATGY